MQNLRNDKRFVHISFRISENLRRELNSEAKRQGINVSALANRVLMKYIVFDRIVEHEHSVVLDRRIFTPIIDKISRDDLEVIGMNLGPRLVKQTLEFFGIEPTVENLISRYFEPMGTYSGRYQSNVVGSGPELKLILEHDYGSKWSAFLAEYVKGVVKSVLGTEPRIELANDLIKVEFQGASAK